MINLIHKLTSAVFALGLIVAGASAEVSTPIEAGQVGSIVSKLLEERHYNARRLDEAMAKEMLKNYLNALDYNHVFFLQSDIDGFQHFTTELNNDLIVGDVKPAVEIYQVYSNRVEQACVTIKELVTEDYRFDENDALILDRHESPWPATAAEQRALLRQRVKYELLEERLNKEKHDEALKIITRRYDRILRSLHENDFDTIVEIYLNSLAMLYDPHTAYLAPHAAEDFAIAMRLSLSGIGAVLQSEDGYAKIVSIVPGGPADLDNRLKVNDRVAGVAQGDGPMMDVVDMKLNKVVEQIRGKKGTSVRLKIIPADAPDPSTRNEISLTRDEIKLTEQEAKAKIIEKSTPLGSTLHLGYIDLPSFYQDPTAGADTKSSSRDIRKLLLKLRDEKVDGLILDLRRNTGGSLPEVINMTGLFIDEGPVVQVKDPQGHIGVGRDQEHGVTFDKPMLVLVTRVSASASEIMAAALQDYGRAIIVGDHQTFGKGTVQQVVDLDQLLPKKRAGTTGSNELKLTIQKFYRVSGGSTQSRGVIPDIVLPSPLDAVKIGENHLPHFLLYDEIQPVSIHRWSQTVPPVDELRRLAAGRVAQNPEYRYILEDTALLKRKTDEKFVTLNEAARLAEKKQNEDRAEARKQERAARHVEALKMTEITLKSLTGSTNLVAAITREVMETAEQNSHTNEAKKTTSAEPAVPAPDPNFDEAVNILADYVELNNHAHAKN